MRARFVLTAIAVASAAAATALAQAPELARDVTVQRGDARGAMQLSFAALGQRFALELEPAALFAPGAHTLWIGDGGAVVEEPSEIYFTGQLDGVAHSRARVSRRGAVLAGVIVTDDEVYFLEPSARDAKTVTVQRQSDIPAAAYGRCGVDQAPIGGAEGLRAARPRAGTSSRAAGVARAEISLVADYEFYRLHGADTAAAMQDKVNVLNAIYERDLGVTFTIRNTVIYTTAGDPFSSTTDPNSLLDEFSSFSGDRNSPVAGSDLTHLFTGRDLKGSVVGIAWLGSVCDGAYATGLSQDLSASLLAGVVAHEIGHNFGAPHDAARCTNPASGYIMQPNLSCVGRSGFSPQSQNDIAAFVDSANCLAGGGAPAATATRTPTRTRVGPLGTPTATRTPAGPLGTPTATRTRAATRTPTPTGPTRTATQTRTPTETPIFSPALLPGLVLWLDAGRLGTLADGAPVAAWSDASATAHDAQQGNAAWQPTYRRSAMNGRAAVRFDGSDDRLAIGGALPNGNNRTVVVVARPDVAGARAVIDVGGFIVTPEHSARVGGGERRWQPAASLSAPSVLVVRQNGPSTTVLAAWVNGVRLGVSLTRAARIATAGSSTLGAPSGGAAGIGAFAGDIAEVLVYDQALSTAEREALERYLRGKYGL